MSKQVMQRALEALEYHVAQTRPIEQTSQAIAELRAEIAKPVEPVAFLADATRFKVRGDEGSEACRIYGIPHELNGRWVALVAADDNCHLKLTAPPDTEAMRRDAERYRWLRSTTNWVSSKGRRIDVRNCPEVWDESIDAAIAAQRGWE